MSISYIRTQDNITYFVDGVPATISREDSRYDAAVEAIKNGDAEALRNLTLESKARHITEITAGKIRFVPEKRALYYNGELISHSIIERLFMFYEEGFPIVNLLRFMDRLMLNPSKRSVDQLYRFIESCNLPITESGHFLAYKVVTSDYKDIRTKTFDNSPGKEVSMPRNQVLDDPNVTCASGLHAASKDYLSYYGNCHNGDNRVVVVMIDPADVVSVPIDHNNSKLRVCRYVVLCEIPYDEAMNDGIGKYVPNDSVWGTQKSNNSQSSDTKQKTPTTSTKLTPDDVRKIRKIVDEGKLSLREVGRMFGVNESTIRKIRDRLIWKNVV